MKTWWVIDVNNYGAFLFEGTGAEAEERRVAKARWEGAVARKRIATPEEVATDNPKSEFPYEVI